MKNIVLTVCLFFSFLTVGMSQFSFGAGAQLIFDGSVFGVQGKALYEINDSWRAAGAFTYHLEDFFDYTIDLDAQYKALEVSDNFDLAPLAGLSISRFSVLGFGTTDTGINLGAFITIGGDNLNFYIEPKLRIGDGGDGLIVSGGVLF